MFSSTSTSGNSTPPEKSWKDKIRALYSKVEQSESSISKSISTPVGPAVNKFNELPQEVKSGLTIVGTALLTLGGFLGCKRYFKRISSHEYVTGTDIAKRRWIKGVVTSVGDADNFRLYHTPGIGWRFPLKFRSIPDTTKALKDKTIHIRMAGVDAPEAAHFGRPSQEYSKEALAWLRSKVLGKRVWCQLVHRDQYGRIVAVPLMKTAIPFRYRCVSLDMLEAGWAVVYEQSNADYGKYGKERFLATEAAAKKARRGMWEYGELKETPAEYKKRYAGEAKSKS